LWSAELVRYSLERDPQLADVLGGWVSQWQPQILEAVNSLGELFEQAAHPVAAADVVEAAAAAQQLHLVACGLAAPSGGS
jgi:toluene monooxygenase system protein E